MAAMGGRMRLSTGSLDALRAVWRATGVVTRRAVCAAIVAMAVLAAGAGVVPARSASPTVVELFTSQGCSSSPPADALLGELAQRADIIALSEHIDYWDYLGWRDPFASAENTRRQRDYSRALGVKFLYTPQIVVQGRYQVAGHDRDAVLAIIAQPAPGIDVQATPAPDGGIEIRIGDAVDVGEPLGPRPATVWLVSYQPRQSTEVKRGENSGRLLVNHNVVKAFHNVGEWSGTASTFSVGAGTLSAGENCAVLVQAGPGGAILGATRCVSPEAASPP